MSEIHPSVAHLQHLVEARQWERLLTMSRKRLAHDVEDQPAHRAAALALIQLQRPAEADRHIAFLLQKAPDYHYHYQLGAQSCIQQARYRQARRLLETALTLAPEEASLHRLAASVLSIEGKVRLAEAHLKKAMELDGISLESWRTREMIFRNNSASKGYWKERIEALENALKLSPEDSFVLWQAGTILLELQRPAAAERWLRRSLQKDPTCPTCIRDWREAYERSNFIYRCLSFPWRGAKAFCIHINYLRNSDSDEAARQAMAIHFWIGMLIWWVTTVCCLAPLGLLVRYFFLLHPALDIRFLPRRQWLRSCSLGLRILLLASAVSLITLAAIQLTSVNTVLEYGTFVLVVLSLQAFVTGMVVFFRRAIYTKPPAQWLS